MRLVSVDIGATTEGDTSDNEEQPHPRWREHLKSGLHRTGATMILNKVTWPHKVVYTLDGKPNTYQDISIPRFVERYLIVMDTEEGLIRQKMSSILKDLMSNAQLYRWDWASTFCGVWLNLLEQGCCTWMDEVEKLSSAGPVSGTQHLLSHLHLPLPGPRGGPVNAGMHKSSHRVKHPGQARHQGLPGLQHLGM